MKNLILMTILAAISIGAACGTKTDATNGNKTTSAADNKTSTASTTTSAASAVVKDIYDDAMRRNCSAIPAKLTEHFKKAVGTSKDELDALCDSITDSGKLASFAVKGEELSGDSGKVKVALTYKDGKTEEKSENVKKSGDKWLMNS